MSSVFSVDDFPNHKTVCQPDCQGVKMHSLSHASPTTAMAQVGKTAHGCAREVCDHSGPPGPQSLLVEPSASTTSWLLPPRLKKRRFLKMTILNTPKECPWIHGQRARRELQAPSSKSRRHFEALFSSSRESLRTVSEVFNPNRFGSKAKKYRLRPGQAFDIQLGMIC